MMIQIVLISYRIFFSGYSTRLIKSQVYIKLKQIDVIIFQFKTDYKSIKKNMKQKSITLKNINLAKEMQ